MSLALVQAVGKVKASIRLAQAVSEFAASLDSHQHKATFKTLQTRSAPSAADVIGFTEELNRDGSRLHRSWLPYGTRLVFVLDKIRLFTKAGDLLVGGSQNMIASGVWAVVRMSLQIATGFLTFFDKVSDVLMRVGRSSLIQQEVVSLFPDSVELQEFMCEYLILVVVFCKDIVSFARKSFLSQLKFSLGASFDPECKTFETSTAVWSGLIDQKVQFLTAESQVFSKKALTKTSKALELLSSSTTKSKALEERRFQFLHQLSPHQGQFESYWRRQRRKGTASWILNTPGYRKWKGSTDSAKIYWVKGNLGSGKTVCLATIAADLSSSVTPGTASPEAHVVASFFCQDDKPETQTASCVMGSIAHQLIKGLDDDSAARVMAKMGTPEKDPGPLTAELIKHLPTSLRRYFVVIDAIDCCIAGDFIDILSCIRDLARSLPLSFCCSTRPRSEIIGTYFDGILSQSTACPEKDAEMACFIACEIERRKGSRMLDAETASTIQRALVAGSHGMYLWVVLQLDRLFPQYPSQNLEQDVDIIRLLDDLPPDLEKSYDKATERCADRETGRRAFQLVSASARPLTLDEFRVALNVEPEVTDWNSSTLIRNSWGAVAGTGCGLIEINEEDQTVHFIHHSALQYMVAEGGSTRPVKVSRRQDATARSLAPFTLEEAERHLAWLCVTYLNYPCFERQLVSSTGATLEGTAATTTILKAAESQGGSTGRIFTHFMRHRPGNSRSVDVVKLLQDYQRSRPQTDDVLHFAEYARDHWVQHSKVFSHKMNQRRKQLFRNLLFSASSHVRSPVATLAAEDALEWAIRDGHAGIFQILMATTSDEFLLTRIMKILQRQGPAGVEGWALKGDGLGNLVARYIHYRGRSGKALVGIEDEIRKLLRLGADPNLPLVGQHEESPLYLAVRYSGDDGLVELLLHNGASLEPHQLPHDAEEGALPMLPVMEAIERHLTMCLELLLYSGADPNRPGPTRTQYDYRNYALVAGVTPLTSPQAPTPLMCALVANRQPEVVAILLKQGADPNTAVNGLQPLHITISRRDVALTELLIKCGARPWYRERASTKAPFLLAIEKKEVRIVSLLADVLDADIINTGMPTTPMRTFCSSLGSPRASALDLSSIMMTLISNGASSDGETDYLALVIENLSLEAVIAFIDAGVLPPTRRLLGDALLAAIRTSLVPWTEPVWVDELAPRLCRHYEALILDFAMRDMLRKGERFEEGSRVVAERWMVELVKAGADPNQRVPWRKTPELTQGEVPLITAAIHNEWEVGVRFLLRVGAKLALDDFSTQNPLVAACQVCSPKMALLVWEAWLPSQPSAALRERVHELALRCLESSWQFSMEEANAILEGIGAKLRFQP